MDRNDNKRDVLLIGALLAARNRALLELYRSAQPVRDTLRRA